MTGAEMTLLRHRVGDTGYSTYQFFYHSVLKTPAENAARLQEFLDEIEEPVVHLVAHSLGGIVLCHLFEQFPLQKPGKVVMLGSPLNNSEVARAYHSFFLTRPLLVNGTQRGLFGDHPGWKGQSPSGMIAGTKSVGIGIWLLAKLPKPNDGTVSVEETHCEAMDDRIELHHSHMGMLLSVDVAEQVSHFLKNGRFQR